MRESQINNCFSSWIFALTRFDGRNASQEGNGIHDAFLSFKSSRPKDPCGTRVNNEDIKEKSSQSGKIVAGRLTLAHFPFFLRSKPILRFCQVEASDRTKTDNNSQLHVPQMKCISSSVHVMGNGCWKTGSMMISSTRCSNLVSTLAIYVVTEYKPDSSDQKCSSCTIRPIMQYTVLVWQKSQGVLDACSSFDSLIPLPGVNAGRFGGRDRRPTVRPE